MSFGWPSSNFSGHWALEAAIDKAYSKKVLMFAAASNSGGRRGRAYPASSSHVICVHSTDGLGNASPFNPTPVSDAMNIATVGESIQSAWPGDAVKYGSGTSFATPILAGIAAFLLQYARLHLPENEALELKRKDRMEAVLKKCAEPRNGYLYVELSLILRHLFRDKSRSVGLGIERVFER